MRTSPIQCEIMVSFMERHGDLSRPFDGPHGRLTNIERWAELTNLLNSEATGDTKTEEKWRKTWSDLKNNTKRKAAKINKMANGTGGGPAFKIKLTNLEERILWLIKPQAAIGMQVPEVGLEQVSMNVPDPSEMPLLLVMEEQETNNACVESQIVASSGSQLPMFVPPPSQSPPAILIENVQTPPQPSTSTSTRTNRRPSPRRRRPSTSQSELSRHTFINSDREWRAFYTEKDERDHALEKERLRLREIELNQQARWQELVAQFLSVLQSISDHFLKKT